MISRRLSIAPMMAYTDRHYRMMMRAITQRTLLYTEMVTTGPLIYGKRQQMLAYCDAEQPLALQLGGSDPADLVVCAKMGEEHGYCEINLNVGCPSNRVSSGRFGACLFKQPQRVAECVAAMQAVVSIPVTVKTRLGVDDYDEYQNCYDFVKTVAEAGCQVFIIHARKAWLKGLSPRANRQVPPLCYDKVYRLKQDFPKLTIVINGGITSHADITNHLHHVDAVMIGREAYHCPLLLADVDRLYFGEGETSTATLADVIKQYMPYVTEQLALGVPLRALLKPLAGLWHGKPGAKQWRRKLNEQSNPEVLQDLVLIL